MFKNLESSKFCGTFIDLHNYQKPTLSIINQFEKIKDMYTHDISFTFNETISLAKVEVDDKTLYDTLNIYGLTLSSFPKEFIFVIAERHNINTRLQKKFVRTTGLQVATAPALELLDDYHKESMENLKSGKQIITSPKNTIKFSEIETEGQE